MPRFLLDGFRLHLPEHRGTHEHNVRWLAAAHAQAEATRRGDAPFDREAFRRQMDRHLRRFGPAPGALGWRRSDIGEFLDENFEAKSLFPLLRLPEGAPMGERMDAFAALAEKAVDALFPSGEVAPDEILHVTCTGYAAPSAVQKLVEKRGWSEQARITHVYHMGCYAALPALRIAAGYLANAPSGSPRCALAHTEICTLHLNPSRHDPEQLVVQSLFADGYIRYGLSRRRDEVSSPGFELLGFCERLIPGSLAGVAWIPGEFGMRMTLSRDVPDRIAAALDPFLTALAAECGLRREALREAAYAVHPGGPRILDKVEEWLRLAPRQLAASREILFERGNMSSATLPHIWDRMLYDGGLAADSLVVSLAFGPGLTLYGTVLRRVGPTAA